MFVKQIIFLGLSTCLTPYSFVLSFPFLQLFLHKNLSNGDSDRSRVGVLPGDPLPHPRCEVSIEWVPRSLVPINKKLRVESNRLPTRTPLIVTVRTGRGTSRLSFGGPDHDLVVDEFPVFGRRRQLETLCDDPIFRVRHSGSLPPGVETR